MNYSPDSITCTLLTGPGNGAIHPLAYQCSLPCRGAWKKLTTIGMAIRLSICGDKETSDVRFYISCLPLDIKLFAKAVRGH